jgi:hypothetical protein
MSEVIGAAIIGVFGGIFTTLITLFGTILIQRHQGNPIPCAMLGLIVSIGGLVGFVIGLFAGTLLIREIQVEPSRSNSSSYIDSPSNTNNLIRNANFEQGLSGWQRHGQTEITSTSSGFSGQAICSRQNTTNGNWSGIYQDISVSSGRSYYVELYTEHKLGVEVHVKVQWLDGNYNVLHDGERVGETANGATFGWERRSKVVTPPSQNIKFARLALWHGVTPNPPTGIPDSEVCVDEAVFRPN